MPVGGGRVTLWQNRLSFPPFAAGIVPGDRVAIAVDEMLPHVGEIVRGVVRGVP